MTTQKDHAEARALLSAAAMWEERLDTSEPRNNDSPPKINSIKSKTQQKNKSNGEQQKQKQFESSDDQRERSESEQYGLKKVLNMEWDDIEKKKFDDAYASAEELVNSLRHTTDTNERAALVAHHVAMKGKLDSTEAKLVMTMSKQKKAEDEHLIHLKNVNISTKQHNKQNKNGDSSSDSDSGSESGSGSDESSDESDVEDYRARERQNRLSVAAATDKADKLEGQQVKLAQRVRDLEMLLYKSEQRAVIAEGTISDIEQKYTFIENEDRRKAAILKNQAQELDSKVKKIAVLESRLGGTALPEIYTPSSAPTSGSQIDEIQSFGGNRLINNSNNLTTRTPSTSSSTSSNMNNPSQDQSHPVVEKKRGFWGNLLRVNQPDPILPDPPSFSAPQRVSKPEPEPEPEPVPEPLEVKKAKVSEIGEAIIVRQQAEFPGTSAGDVINPGAEFDYVNIIQKKVEILVSLSSKTSQTAKMIEISFYELKDGKGFVPDFNKNDPLVPLINLINNSNTDSNKDNHDIKDKDKSLTFDQTTRLNVSAPKESPMPPQAPTTTTSTSRPGSPRSSPAPPALGNRSRGRVSAVAVKKKKKEKVDPGPPPPPPGPQVLEIRFEECGDESFGLVLCPTRYGLEVVHTQGAAAQKGVPLGSLIDSVGNVNLANRAQLKQNSLTYLKDTLNNNGDNITKFDHQNNNQNNNQNENGGGKDGGQNEVDEKWTEEDALLVSEKTFLELVAKVLPRPVHIGFIIPAEHKAFLERKNKSLEKELKLANEQIRTFRAQQQQSASSSSSNVMGLSNSSGSGNSSGKRLTLKQRQEVLKKKQEEMKALRLGAANKNKAGAGGKGEPDPLPDYLKHCSASQKKQYLNLVASEKDWKNKVEDLNYKNEDLEARKKLAEDDAEESSQLLAQCQRDVMGKVLEIKSLVSQVDALKHGAEINDKSHGIMKIKDERLAWFEGELAHLRNELLHLTNIRGDNVQLKEWLETERIAHLKQVEVFKKSSDGLAKDNVKHLAKIYKLENGIKTKDMELKDSANLLQASKLTQQKKEQNAIYDMVRDILQTSVVDHIVYGCENVTIKQVYSRKKDDDKYVLKSGIKLVKTVEFSSNKNEKVTVKRGSSFVERSLSFIQLSSTSNQNNNNVNQDNNQGSKIKNKSLIAQRKVEAENRKQKNQNNNHNSNELDLDTELAGDLEDENEYNDNKNRLKKASSSSFLSFSWLCQGPKNDIKNSSSSSSSSSLEHKHHQKESIKKNKVDNSSMSETRSGSRNRKGSRSRYNTKNPHIDTQHGVGDDTKEGEPQEGEGEEPISQDMLLLNLPSSSSDLMGPPKGTPL